jgi:hypothetical protein
MRLVPNDMSAIPVLFSHQLASLTDVLFTTAQGPSLAAESS